MDEEAPPGIVVMTAFSFVLMMVVLGLALWFKAIYNLSRSRHGPASGTLALNTPRYPAVYPAVGTGYFARLARF